MSVFHHFDRVCCCFCYSMNGLSFGTRTIVQHDHPQMFGHFFANFPPNLAEKEKSLAFWTFWRGKNCHHENDLARGIMYFSNGDSFVYVWLKHVPSHCRISFICVASTSGKVSFASKNWNQWLVESAVGFDFGLVVSSSCRSQDHAA